MLALLGPPACNSARGDAWLTSPADSCDYTRMKGRPSSCAIVLVSLLHATRAAACQLPDGRLASIACLKQQQPSWSCQPIADAHLAASAAGFETSDVSGVMDGALDGFITAYLREKGKQQQEARLAAPTA